MDGEDVNTVAQVAIPTGRAIVPGAVNIHSVSRVTRALLQVKSPRGRGTVSPLRDHPTALQL